MKGEIIFYDYEFNCLGRSKNIAYVYHKELYNGIGTFEASISVDDPMAQIISQRDFTVAIWEKAQAIITSWEIDDSEEMMKIYGRTPNWILSKRACPNFKRRTGTPFALTAALVREVWGDVIKTGIGADIAEKEIDFWRNVYNPLSEVVSDCLDRCKAGHRVVFDKDNKQWRFEMFTGKERSCVFSNDRQNVFGMTAKKSILDYYNGGFYTTDEESEEWKEIPSDKEGIYRWTVRLTSSGESSAQSELKRKKIEDTIDFSVTNTERTIEVGDIVEAQRIKGVIRKRRRMRVTAIERWIEGSLEMQRPILEELEEV